MNVIFVSSRGKGRQEQGQQNQIGDKVNITVASHLVLRFLPQILAGPPDQILVDNPGQPPDQILADPPGQPGQPDQPADNQI